MKIQSIVSIIASLTVLFFVVACDKSDKEAVVPDLRIGHAPHDHHSPLYIAAMNPDHFKEHHGIYLKEIVVKKEYELMSGSKTLARVHIDSTTGGKKLISRLSEDQLDLTLGGIPAMLGFIDKGEPIKVVAPVNADGAGLVVGKHFKADSWGEFVALVRKSSKPIKIGFKMELSTQNLIFEAALKEVGITYSKDLADQNAQVILANLHGAKNLIPAMKKGIIDGFVVNQPFPAKAEVQGAGKAIAQLFELPPEGKWQGAPCCALAAREDYIEKQSEAVQAMTSLLLHANIFMGKQPEKSMQQVAAWLGIDPEVESKSIPTISFTADFDEKWDRGVDFWVQTMIDNGKYNNKVKDAYQAGKLNHLIYDNEVYSQARKGLK